MRPAPRQAGRRRRPRARCRARRRPRPPARRRRPRRGAPAPGTTFVRQEVIEEGRSADAVGKPRRDALDAEEQRQELVVQRGMDEVGGIEAAVERAQTPDHVVPLVLPGPEHRSGGHLRQRQRQEDRGGQGRGHGDAPGAGRGRSVHLDSLTPTGGERPPQSHPPGSAGGPPATPSYPSPWPEMGLCPPVPGSLPRPEPRLLVAGCWLLVHRRFVGSRQPTT